MSVLPPPEAPLQDINPLSDNTTVGVINELIGQEIAYYIVLGCAGFGIFWGIINTILVSRVDMDDHTHLRKEEGEGESKSLLQHKATSPEEAEELLEKMKHIGHLISDVSLTFLK